ncbi:MAG: hypothetical protein LWW85_06545 [Marinilabiliales bacterium]|nr:hypothetical protein [Marinilabiliales bacterium]
MKTQVKLIVAIATMVTACTPGAKITSGGYSDDLYYTPGDARPVAAKPVEEVKKPLPKSMIAMQVEENEQGKVVNNYIVPKGSRKDNNVYYFDDQPQAADTAFVYKDGKEQVTINNYYEGEEMNYTSRIRNFYDPYFYDPYWDPYWSSGWGLGWNYGLGWGYNSWYPGWNWGFGFYSPYWAWNNYWTWGPGYYYPGYYYGNYWGWNSGWGWNDSYWASGNHRTGKQNYTGRSGGSSAVNYGMNNNKNGMIGGSGMNMGRVSGSSFNRLPSVNQNGAVNASTRPAYTGGAGATGTRLQGTRENNTVNQAIQGGTSNGAGNRLNRGETLSNLRRPSGLSNGNNNSSVQQGRVSRPSANSSNGEYTPVYSRPRMNTQPTYNSGNNRQYSSPQGNGSEYQSNRYSRPAYSGNNSNSGTRTQSTTTYQRGSVNSSYSNTPTRSVQQSSSGRSYSTGSTESRSYSSPTPSYSGGSRSSFGGGGSAPASSGGGGRESSGGGGGGGRGGR